MFAGFDATEVDREATLHGFTEVVKQLFETLPLAGATRYGRNFSPEPAFVCLVNNCFQLQCLSSQRARCCYSPV